MTFAAAKLKQTSLSGVPLTAVPDLALSAAVDKVAGGRVAPARINFQLVRTLTGHSAKVRPTLLLYVVRCSRQVDLRRTPSVKLTMYTISSC